jgi:hypothetical protein
MLTGPRPAFDTPAGVVYNGVTKAVTQTRFLGETWFVIWTERGF